MAFIRPIDVIARKFATVTPQRSGDYQAGVENPRKDWKISTAAAEQAYEGGVTTAIAKKAFGKGVNSAGTEKWKRGATTKGTQRWGPGVALAEGDYRAGFAPYRDAIERVALPQRFQRRDPRNLDRVGAVVKALVAAKEARQGK
jgi:hypothetical protein